MVGCYASSAGQQSGFMFLMRHSGSTSQGQRATDVYQVNQGFSVVQHNAGILGWLHGLPQRVRLLGSAVIGSKGAGKQGFGVCYEASIRF